MQLVIGNKNYSTWSMRPWLLLRHHGLDFEEITLALFTEGYQDALAQYSPSLRVPVLIDGGITVWDSLAICEYVNEKYLTGSGYPADLDRRARCRSYCNEMHSGFTAIRGQLPMNCRARRRLALTATVTQEVQRVDAIWSEARALYGSGGNYLFGEFGIVDCMFAPMAMRFHTYGVELSNAASDYVETLLVDPAVLEWREGAQLESEVLPRYELGEELVKAAKAETGF